MIGNKKPQSYYRDVVWRTSPITMAVHRPIPTGMRELVGIWGWPDELQSWNWSSLDKSGHDGSGAEGQPLQVRVFSRAPRVRLLLNGTVIGEQKMLEGKITATFSVSYAPGVLKAVNIENGKETNAVELKTTGSPRRLRLVADRNKLQNSRNDLSYVMVEVTDEKGQVVPEAEIPVQFSISGVGELAGVGNGNPTDTASFQRPMRKTWRGKCLAIVRPTGKTGQITLTATANGFPSTQLILTTN